MKKTIYLAIMFVAMVVLVSCTGKKTDADAEGTDSTAVEAEVTEPEVEPEVEAVEVVEDTAAVEEVVGEEPAEEAEVTE